MTQHATTDVLICGAGAAGLTLAIELARRGIAFRLIDKAAGPFLGSRGKGIQPRSLEVFEDLGVVNRLAAAGGFYPPQRVYRDGGFDESPIMEDRDPAPDEPYRRPLMVPQFLTEAILRARLAELGHHPQFDCALAGLEQDGEGVIARISQSDSDTRVRARYLVGTDGGRSFVRQALDIAFPGETLGVRAVVADVVLDGLGTDAWHRWSGHPPMSLCPLRGTTLFQLQAPVALEGDVDLSAEGLQAMVKARTGRDDIIIHSVAWASAYTMNARLADHYRVARIFLAGDAAHIHPPTGGQGLNTSVQDAYNLGWKLAAVLQGAPEVLLDTYEAERRPIAAGMLGLAAKLLDESRKSADMRRGRETHQLDLGYPLSTLSLERPIRTTGIHAGHRAPDAPCRGAAGQAIRLFDLFRGPHWTLLGYAADPASVPAARRGLHVHRVGPGGDVVDDQDHIRRAYGVASGDWVLIRPDGYVGAVVATTETAALRPYLAAVGLQEPA